MKEEITKTTSIEATKLTTTSNIWEDLKERLSAPFFASFIISWIICNWKIIVVLFWFGKDVDGPTGATTRIELIYKYSSHWRTMWFPFVLAIAYCWLYPAFKAFSDWLVAHIKTRASSKILKASGKAKVEMSLFLDLKAQYDKANKSLENIFEDSRKFTVEKAFFQQEILSLKLEIEMLQAKNTSLINNNNSLETELENFQKLFNTTRYLGKYRVLYINAQETVTDIIEIEIKLSFEKGAILNWTYKDNFFHSNRLEEYKIRSIMIDSSKKHSLFLLQELNGDKAEFFEKILLLRNYNEEEEKFEGHLIGTTKTDVIQLKRI